MPSLDEFFAEAIEQADPANMVEDEYKYVWKLVCKFDFFFPHQKSSTGFSPSFLCVFVWLFCFFL